MKNSHGVLIEMVATHVGLNLRLGHKGVTIALEKWPGRPARWITLRGITAHEHPILYLAKPGSSLLTQRAKTI